MPARQRAIPCRRLTVRGQEPSYPRKWESRVHHALQGFPLARERRLVAVRDPNLTRKNLFFKHRELGLSSYRFYGPKLLSTHPYQASSQFIYPFLFNDAADVPWVGARTRGFCGTSAGTARRRKTGLRLQAPPFDSSDHVLRHWLHFLKTPSNTHSVSEWQNGPWLP